jgi:hypothetical protein
MCYYTSIRYSCGHRRELRETCGNAVEIFGRQYPYNVVEPCKVKIVRKAMYEPDFRLCLQPSCWSQALSWCSKEPAGEYLSVCDHNDGPHGDLGACDVQGCVYLRGHSSPHRFPYRGLAREFPERMDEITKESVRRLQLMNLLVLGAMGISGITISGPPVEDNSANKSQLEAFEEALALRPARSSTLRQRAITFGSVNKQSESVYSGLNFKKQ